MECLDKRMQITRSRFLLIKVGTEILHSENGMLALGQIGDLVEQIAALYFSGHRIVLVSSGSVTIGRKLLHRQFLLSGSMQFHLCGGGESEVAPGFPEKACAAAGQSGLQSLYEMLFSQYQLPCCQVLASDSDFHDVSIRKNLNETINALLRVGVIPIINENDVITKRKAALVDARNRIAWDNDSLASHFAAELRCEVLIVVTDVDGVHTEDSNGVNHVIRDYCVEDTSVALTANRLSRVGPEGQKEKWMSCIRAVRSKAVQAALIVKAETGVLARVMDGRCVGTLFTAEEGVKEDTKLQPVSRL